jgi:hypothetical protein
MVYLHSKVFSVIKKHEIMTFAGKGMGLETIMLSKIIGGGAVGGVRGQERVLGINMIKV